MNGVPHVEPEAAGGGERDGELVLSPRKTSLQQADAVQVPAEPPIGAGEGGDVAGRDGAAGARRPSREVVVDDGGGSHLREGAHLLEVELPVDVVGGGAPVGDEHVKGGGAREEAGVRRLGAAGSGEGSERGAGEHPGQERHR